MYTLALTLLALALAAPALAQTTPPAPADTAHFYKHHLGLTASPQLDHFFTANRSLPVGLLYKRQTKPGKLWRFGLTLNQDYSRQNEYKPDYSPTNLKNNPEFTNSSFGVSLSIGQELTHQFASRWIGTVGADLSLGFSQYKYINTYQRLGNPANNIPSTEVKDGDRFRYYNIVFSPFIGLRFMFWQRLYLSAESALKFNYLRQTRNGLGSVIDLTNGQLLIGSSDFIEQQDVIQSFNLKYNFINQLTIHYMLGH